MSGNLFKPVADWRCEYPVPGLQSRSHQVGCAPRVGATLVLEHGGLDVFRKLLLGIVADFRRRRFKQASGRGD